MLAKDVVLQLFSQLPKYTDYFSTNISITALNLVANVVTATTAIPHGLSIGKTVNITGAVIKNPIISLTQINNIATAVTQNDHDLTEGFNCTVNITGANQADYNGTKTLLTVPNRRTFTFKIANNPITPATGTIFLNETERTINPYNGLKIIVSVPTATTFTYAVSQSVYSPPSGTIVAKTGLRVGGAISFDKANEWYSKQAKQDYWLFVVLGDVTASKDRYTGDDATATTPKNTRYRERAITPVTLFIFAPSPDDTTILGVNGREVADIMHGPVFYALCKSVLRKKFKTIFSENVWSELMFVNHGYYGYNQSYYVHQFTFESTFDITYSDTIAPDDNVAFRNIELNFQRLTDDYILATASINLDDQPL